MVTLPGPAGVAVVDSGVVKPEIEALEPDDPALVAEPAVGSNGSAISLAGTAGCSSVMSLGSEVVMSERLCPVGVAGVDSGKAVLACSALVASASATWASSWAE